MEKNIIGKDLSLGQRVRITKSFDGEVQGTMLVGEITGLRIWRPGLMAIEIRGFDDWILLEGSINVEAIY